MKKLTRIAAPVAMTALLSACATVDQGATVDPTVGPEEIKGKVEVVLADRAVATLEADLAAFKKQFDKARNKAKTPEDNEILDRLEDPFADIKTKFADVKNETDPIARFGEAEKLKGELEGLAARLDNICDSKSGCYYREVKYTFKNLDAVQATEQSRIDYKKALNVLFKEGKIKGEVIFNPKKPDYDAVPYPDDFENKNVSEVIFTLSDLKNGISVKDLREIEKGIKRITDETPVMGIKGIPVVKRDLPEKPIEFRIREVEFSSASGVPVAAADVIDPPDQECLPIVGDYGIGAIVKQRDADRYLWYNGRLSEGKPVEIPFTFQPDSDSVSMTSQCQYTQNESEIAYLMVLLEEELAGGKSYVAEYHEVKATIDPANLKITVERRVVSGGLTDDKPACPPRGWTPKEDFEKKLRDCVPFPVCPHMSLCYQTSIDNHT